ncbi:MAG: pseudouridine synthase [Candidatus Ancaeobacter aquaticus]|nr:pseudouridine synthase [Candidatus Ancaeobacter aquaticus]
MPERLQKVMAQAGIASRRKSEEIITHGRVTVNGEVVTQMGKLVSSKDKICVDGKSLSVQKKTYILLNKPAGYVCSAVQKKDKRPIVLQLVHEKGLRLFTVGRLDYDTNGALLLTNDGDFSLKVSHPRYEVQKVYDVVAKGVITQNNLKRLEKGIVLDGKKVYGTKINKSRPHGDKTFVTLAINEGRNRQVKRMFNEIGHRVVNLKRVKIGFLSLGTLKSGQYRYLTDTEVKKILAQEPKIQKRRPVDNNKFTKSK